MKIGDWKSANGFTLVELLVVIAIIGILAGMLLPVIAAAKTRAQVAQTQTQIADLVNAIQSYEQDYGRFPVSTNAQRAASLAGGDFTFGATFKGGTVQNPASYLYQANNAEIIAILMNLETYPNGVNTPNYRHVKNPKQVQYLNAKFSGYDPASTDKPFGGVDITGVYRDPWGYPYVISLDLNYDEKCTDAFYRLDKVSGKNQTAANPGLNGLTTDGTPDHFQLAAKVMVWSAGWKGSLDFGDPATDWENRRHVLSWK